MAEFVGSRNVWRWGLDTWVAILGFTLGLLALPVGHGLDKSRILKWWLRIDFTISLILAIPFFLLASAFLPTTIAETDNYIIYRIDGLLANRGAFLAKKCGLFNRVIIDLWPYEGGRLQPEQFRIDTVKGYFYGKKQYSHIESSRIWVMPIDDNSYSKYRVEIIHLIDSIWETQQNWREEDCATFVLPDNFTRIEYWRNKISVFDSVEYVIDYNPWTRIKNGQESVQMQIIKQTHEEIYLPKDSVPWMSPIEVHLFIKDLERRFEL